jgi:hypothetical protein
MGRRILVRPPSPGRRFYRTYYDGTDPRAALIDEFRLHLQPGELHDKMMLALHIGASVMLGRVPHADMYAQAKLFAERASQQAEGVKRLLEHIRSTPLDSSAQSPSPVEQMSTPVAQQQTTALGSAVSLPPPLPIRLAPRLGPISVPADLHPTIEPLTSGSGQPVSDRISDPDVALSGAQPGTAGGRSQSAAQAAFDAFGS